MKHCFIFTQKGGVVSRRYEGGDLFGRFKEALKQPEVERSLFSSSDEDDLEETRESLQKEWEIISEIDKVEEELARVNKQMKYEQCTRKKRIYKRIKIMERKLELRWMSEEDFNQPSTSMGRSGPTPTSRYQPFSDDSDSDSDSDSDEEEKKKQERGRGER